MRRNKTLKRSRVVTRVVPILLAGCIGYLIGGVDTTTLHSTDVSATAAIALRFPSDWNNPSPRAAIAALPAALNVSSTAGTDAARDAQLALLSPQPMVPPTVPQATAQADPVAPAADDASQAVAQTPVQMAAVEQPAASPMPDASGPAVAPPARAAQAPSEAKASASAVHHHLANRPGYMLDDAQIASIKERLHLTPDQEAMWPAVEAALRNMAYTHLQEAHNHGAAAPAQTAAVDPGTVQGLKSAAVPLILSFNAEQKEEVRNIAHVMGLDQLASQF
jgi:hypothetical protein